MTPELKQACLDQAVLYRFPDMNRIIRAVPMLQWRSCRCGHRDLYRSNMLPVSRCRACNSVATQVMTHATRLLHDIHD